MARKRYSKGKRYSSDNSSKSNSSAAIRGSTGSSAVFDPSWVMKSKSADGALAGKLGFVSTVGNSLPFLPASIGTQTYYGVTRIVDKSRSVPGIMQLHLAHTIGTSADPQNTVNECATGMYSKMREMMTNSFDWSKSAMMLTEIAIGELMAAYALGIRAWAFSRVNPQFNRYAPEALTYACGWDWADMLENRDRIKTYLNLMVDRISRLKIPAGFAYFARRFALYQNVFMDENSDRCQLYIYKPDYLFQLDRDNTGNMVLNTLRVPATFTYTTYMAFCESLISKLINDTDVAKINGAILKCYDQFFALPVYDDNLYPSFTYDELALGEIQNSQCVGSVNFMSDDTNTAVADYPVKIVLNSLYEDEIVTVPTIGFISMGTGYSPNNSNWATAMRLIHGGRLLNTNTPEPTSAQVYDMTLFSVGSCKYVERSDNSEAWIVPLTCPTELVTSFTMFIREDDGTWTGRGLRPDYLYTSGGTGNVTQISDLGFLSNFRKHPIVALWMNTNSNTHAHLDAFATDMDNYTFVEPTRMDDIRRTAMYSLFMLE